MDNLDRPLPKNWLVESILVTIFCCLPFGIAGIIFAAKVESKYNQGDYEGAEHAAAEAKKWTKVSFFVGLIGVIIYIAIMALGIGTAALSQ